MNDGFNAIGCFHVDLSCIVSLHASSCMVMSVLLHVSCTGCHCCLTSESESSSFTFHSAGFSSSSKRVTIQRTQRTTPPNMSAQSSKTDHFHLKPETHRYRNPSDTVLLDVSAACLLIHQDEFLYFNLSRRLQLSAQSRGVQRRHAADREKDCY